MGHKKKERKPISQLMPIYNSKQIQLKYPFNLVEHCPLYEHRLAGQLKSIKFNWFKIQFVQRKENTICSFEI